MRHSGDCMDEDATSILPVCLWTVVKPGESQQETSGNPTAMKVSRAAAAAGC